MGSTSLTDSGKEEADFFRPTNIVYGPFQFTPYLPFCHRFTLTCKKQRNGPAKNKELPEIRVLKGPLEIAQPSSFAQRREDLPNDG